MSTFYGSDTSCISDIGLTDVQVTDPSILIGQRIARNLQVLRGGYASVGDDPKFGWDSKQYTNMKLTPALIALGQQQVRAECERDEQVQAAFVVFVLNSQGMLQSISINLQSAAGPFTLTGNVNTITGGLIFSFSS